MINVQAEVITEYLTDSVNKAVIIDASHEGGRSLEDVNYYTGGITDTNYISYRRNGTFSWVPLYSSDNMADIDWSDNVEFDYVSDHDYIVVAMRIDFNVVSGSFPGTATWRIMYHKTGDTVTTYTLNLGAADMASLTGGSKVDLVFQFAKPQDISDIAEIDLVLPGSATVEFDTQMDSVQVNFTDNSTYTPPYSLAPDFNNFDPDDYGTYDIDNNNLLYEDFTLTESLCSQNNIKFGLCESAHCEFSEVGVNAVKVGDKLNIFSELPDYPVNIPNDVIESINWIDESPTKQWSYSASNANLYYIIRFYNRENNYYDLSQYFDDFFDARYIGIQLDLKLNILSYSASERPAYIKLWARFVNDDGTMSYVQGTTFYPIGDYEGAYNTISMICPANGKDKVALASLLIGFYKSDEGLFQNGETITANIDYKHIQYHSLASGSSTIPAYNANSYYIYNDNLDRYLEAYSNRIPLGVFKVASVSNEYKHNLIQKKITAYDNLLILENNAADWYTRYMFGVDFYGYTDAGFEYARQIFSTYWDYVSSVGLDSIDNYNLSDYATLSNNDFICDSGNCYGYVRWDMGPGNYYYRSYAGKNVAITDNTLLYRVIYDNYNGLSDLSIMQAYNPHYVDSGFDTIWRGFGDIGGVLIEEYKTGEADPINRICVNRGDFFMLTPETDSIKVILPSGSTSALGYSLCQNIKVQTAPRRQDLTNGHLRLCYYNYDQKTIFACESNITGRDVVRSLLEVCGCFFRLDRYNGLPEFVYPTKGGLYPSNTLYPADDLYPRAGTDQLYSMGKYLSVIAENYEVKDFGRIQILKKIKSSDTQSVVEWQYEGDPDMENTYIIDDNIFYCAEEMEYDYDGMPEVASMLEGMWGVISNLGYVPNITQALGAPWLECGDRVGLLTYDGGFETFVFRRTLKGIQNLRDTYESEGDELNVAISNFGYSV